jgi:glycosyltransferase involved in cell wall biosynthesis
MSAPLVDVGIPTYGTPAYLAEAIECVLGQTLTAWRLTISENGEGNEFVARVVEPYLSDPRVSHVVVGQNVGSAGNTTRLVRTGSARYVGILHDDDRWAPEFLQRRVDFLDRNRSCGLVFSACDFVDSAGAVVYREDPQLAEGLQDRTEFLLKLYRYNMICTPAALVPRAVYDAVGPAYDGSVLFHDYEMWLRIAVRFEVGFLSGCDVAYRLHPTQTSEGARRRWGEHRLAVLDAAESALPADFPSLERRRAYFFAHGRAVFDAFARRHVSSALVHAGRSVRCHPLAPVDPATYWGGAAWIFRRHFRRRIRSALRGDPTGAVSTAGETS